jgi:hypothetical protein
MAAILDLLFNISITAAILDQISSMYFMPTILDQLLTTGTSHHSRHLESAIEYKIQCYGCHRGSGLNTSNYAWCHLG